MFKSIPDKITWDPFERAKLSLPEITKKIGIPKKSRKRVAIEPMETKKNFDVCSSFYGGMNHNVNNTH